MILLGDARELVGSIEADCLITDPVSLFSEVSAP